ncbi:MAG: AAA family ATPase [Agathobacter sp.]|nr:AAA family ATPase [Agathobacter sp.]
MELKYNYYECEKFETQYEDYDFEENKIVNARYVKALVECDVGNPYIEALPHPRHEDDVRDAYTKHLLTYDYDKVKNMTKLEKMLQVSTLRQIRFPLTFHKNLEFSFYNALITSYRSRKIKPINDKPIEYISNDIETETNCVLYGNSADSTNAGFSLIGYSGCGKSSAIQTLLSHYPQTIIHRVDEFTQYVQIVYLVVNCVPNSNFSALYEGIGDAVDKALGNTQPVYAKEIAKTTTLGRKMEKVRELIERFGIGMIIFDEIQLIDFDRTKESSFESLMTLSNRTKVAIAVVGTEDARDKMFKELRTTRRIGTVINGNMYCENKMFFTFLVTQLFNYQWFDEPIEATEDLVNALYDVTKGIVDQLIGIYSCMHYDYLERKKRPVIDAKYVYDIAQRYYPGIQHVLADLESVEAARKLMSIRRDAEVRVASIIDNAKQEKEAEDLLQKQNKVVDKMLMLKNIVANITALYDEYSLPEIEKAFNLVVKQTKDNPKSEREMSRLVLDKLTHKRNTKSADKKKKSCIPEMDTTTMRDFIG